MYPSLDWGSFLSSFKTKNGSLEELSLNTRRRFSDWADSAVQKVQKVQSMFKKHKKYKKYVHCTHRQVDIGDPLLSGDLRKVEGEDEVDVVGRPAHHEDHHHHPEHLHLKLETCRIWPSGVVFLCSSISLRHVTQLTLFEMHQHGR